MTGHPRHRKSSVLRVCERCRQPWPCPTSRATDDAIASLLVRLARSARNDAVPAASTGPTEGPDSREDNGPSRREEAPHLTTNGTRTASKGSPRTSTSSGATRPAFRGARVDGGTPPASSGSAERSTLTAKAPSRT